jgi:hypothetical protein
LLRFANLFSTSGSNVLSCGVNTSDKCLANFLRYGNSYVGPSAECVRFLVSFPNTCRAAVGAGSTICTFFMYPAVRALYKEVPAFSRIRFSSLCAVLCLCWFLISIFYLCLCYVYPFCVSGAENGAANTSNCGQVRGSFAGDAVCSAIIVRTSASTYRRCTE